MPGKWRFRHPVTILNFSESWRPYLEFVRPGIYHVQAGIREISGVTRHDGIQQHHDSSKTMAAGLSFKLGGSKWSPADESSPKASSNRMGRALGWFSVDLADTSRSINEASHPDKDTPESTARCLAALTNRSSNFTVTFIAARLHDSGNPQISRERSNRRFSSLPAFSRDFDFFLFAYFRDAFAAEGLKGLFDKVPVFAYVAKSAEG